MTWHDRGIMRGDGGAELMRGMGYVRGEEACNGGIYPWRVA